MWCCYAGATLGGGQGLMTAVRTKPELGIDTTRLRINRVLNLSGKTGRSAGNALGCLGLFYASTESGLDYLNDGRLPDLCASLGAGAIPFLDHRCLAYLLMRSCKDSFTLPM